VGTKQKIKAKKRQHAHDKQKYERLWSEQPQRVRDVIRGYIRNRQEFKGDKDALRDLRTSFKRSLKKECKSYGVSYDSALVIALNLVKLSDD